MSQDRGKNWAPMKELASMLPTNCLQGKTRITYWFFSDTDKNFIAVGTTSGLLISEDAGATWLNYFAKQESLASLMIDKTTLVHATNAGIFKLDIKSSHFEPLLNVPLGSAAMGQDKQGLTLVGVEKTTKPEKKMFIKKADATGFSQQTQPVDRFVRMAPGNSRIIYFTGNQSIDQGQAIWFSADSGDTWSQRFTTDLAAYKNEQ